MAEDYTGAVARSPASRVWVIQFGIKTPTDEMLAALASHRLSGQLEASRGYAFLYVPLGAATER